MCGSNRFVPDHGTPPEHIECDELVLKASLSSPNPAVLSQLRRGTVLMLQRRGTTGPLLAVTDDGLEAGSITGAFLGRLVECIRNGYSYVAEVKGIQGGRCELEIRPE